MRTGFLGCFASSAPVLPSFTDHFTRADAASFGANWDTAGITETGWQIVSAQAKCAGASGFGNSTIALAAADFTAYPDQYVQFVWKHAATNGYLGAILRGVTGVGGYVFEITDSNNFYLGNCDANGEWAGAFFGGSPLGVTLVDGDVVRVEVRGNANFTVKVNGATVATASQGSGASLLTGQPGLWCHSGPDGAVDDFICGVAL